MLLWGAFLYDNRTSDSQGNVFYWFCCIIIILTFGLRYRVGGDTLNYLWKYELISPLSQLSFAQLFLLETEPGFGFLLSFFKQFTDDFYCVQLTESFFVNVVWFKLIENQVQNKFFAAFLFFIMHSFYFNTEIMREAIAVGFFTIAYLQLRKGNIAKFYLWMIPSLLFHYSAFFMLVVPLFNEKVKNRKQVILLIISLYFLTGVIPVLFPYFDGYLGTKIANNESYAFTVWGIIAAAIKYVIYPAFLLGLYKHYVNTSDDSDEVKLLYTAMIFGSLSLGEYSILMRLSNYMQPFLLIILVRILRKLSFGNSTQAIYLLAIVGLLWINNLGFYFKDESKYVKGARYYCRWYPYYSIFDEHEDPTREIFVRGQFDNLNDKR